jgi:ElaB/YqjD/DUF883 family membrane-anchored ribosome-binding protein
LIERVNDLERLNLERNTELVFARRSMSTLAEEKAQLDLRADMATKELSEYRSKAKREVKLLKEHVQRLSDENVQMTQAFENMRAFFEKVRSVVAD